MPEEEDARVARVRLGSHPSEERLRRHRRRTAQLLDQPHPQILPLAVPPECVPRGGAFFHGDHVDRVRAKHSARGGLRPRREAGRAAGRECAHLFSGLTLWNWVIVALTAAPCMAAAKPERGGER